MTSAVPEGEVPPERLEEIFGAELALLQPLLGASIASARPLSSFRRLDSPRMAFCLELTDGRRVKLRRFRDRSRLLCIEELLAAASSGDFGRVLLRTGNLLVEEWVDGQAVQPADLDRLTQAGAVLGRLHTLEAVQDRRLRTLGPTTGESAAFRGDLDELGRQGALDAASATALVLVASRHDPGTTEFGAVHGDFCAENFVIDRTDRLRVIDNEHLGIGALDGDVIRSAVRWPLDPRGRAAFLAGYRRFRDPSGAELHRLFWQLRWLALSARVRLLENDRQASARRVHTMLKIAADDSPAEDRSVTVGFR